MSPTATDSLRKTTIRRLETLRERVAATQTAVTAIPEDNEDSACMLEQHSKQIADAKSELKDVRASTLDIGNHDSGYLGMAVQLNV